MDGFAYWILAMGDRARIKKSQKKELSAFFLWQMSEKCSGKVKLLLACNG